MANRDFKVLIVEDEKTISDRICSIFNELSSRAEVTVADSRDVAFQYLNDPDMFFDFITLDLQIPNESGGFEKSPENGLAVLGQCKRSSQGTPVLIFTATSTVKMITRFLTSSHNIDIWSEGIERPTIDHLTKTDVTEFRQKAESIVRAVISLSDIELNFTGSSLPIEHDRLIRVFTKKQGGLITDVKSIGGGLSDAKVYSLHVKDCNGKTIHRAVAKCGPMEDIEEDSCNYDSKINRLKPEATPRKLQHIKFGAKSSSGVFYGLASDYNYSFFKSAEDGLTTNELRAFIIDMMKDWYKSASQQRVSIQEIRRNLVNDERAAELIQSYGITWAEQFEKNQVQSNIACFHGDLHGENILVDVEGNRATLIDYGDVSEGSITIDPITLECSFLFHPAAQKYDWPKKDNIDNWEDIDKYVLGSPIEGDIRFCREWLESVRVGNRELAACLYSYSLRQLKYPETDKERALGLLEASCRIYENS